MVVQTLASSAYRFVEHTWLASSVLIKYVLALHIAELLYRREFDLKHLEDIILKYSRPVVALMAVLGLVTALSSVTIDPNFRLLSELAAVFYFGFLFWKF